MRRKVIRNTDGLKEFAKQKNKLTIEKVNAAIDKLKRSKNKSINFKTVADEAGVSKATLYNNPVLKERIESLRALQRGTNNTAGKDEHHSTDDRIKKLYEEIRILKQQKQDLILQLIEMEELKEENKRLKAFAKQNL
jgi:hypothetical protein